MVLTENSLERAETAQLKGLNYCCKKMLPYLTNIIHTVEKKIRLGSLPHGLTGPQAANHLALF